VTDTKKIFSLAYSSCPNDTFIFHGLAHEKIDLGALGFSVTMADVETLNQAAEKKQFDVTKLSFAALGHLRETYGLLRTGAALGRGCGPLVISMPGKKLSGSTRPVIAVPGLGTTAFLLFRFYLADLYPGIDPQFIPMPFEKIMPSVLASQSDIGVIIHEGRFVYDTLGLDCLADLGQWWEEKTSLPIPLGCIAIRRDIDPGAGSAIERLIGKSIDYAYSHPVDGKNT